MAVDDIITNSKYSFFWPLSKKNLCVPERLSHKTRYSESGVDSVIKISHHICDVISRDKFSLKFNIFSKRAEKKSTFS